MNESIRARALDLDDAVGRVQMSQDDVAATVDRLEPCAVERCRNLTAYGTCSRCRRDLDRRASASAVPAMLTSNRTHTKENPR